MQTTRFEVIDHPTRAPGYAIRAIGRRPSWSPTGVFGWYRIKRDAAARAAELNAAEIKREGAAKPTAADQADIDAAQAAMVENIRKLRLGLDDLSPTDLLRMLLISVFEWCDHHGVDFDASVSAVRDEFAAVIERKSSAG